MKKLLFQSDDYGLTRAVSEGILIGIQNGIIKNTGLFVNMDHSQEAANKIVDVDVCLGIDINFVAGKPVTRIDKVPNLVNSAGNFISSREQIKQNKLISLNGIICEFEEDPYPYEEVLLETENQVKHFIKLTGRKPEYLHPHSLCTPNTERAAKIIADKFGIFHTINMMYSPKYKELPGAIMQSKNLPLETQLNVDISESFVQKSLPELKDGDIGYYVTHCGYVDHDLFTKSSLTLRRIRDLEMAINPNVIKHIEEKQIKLISYRELL